MDTEPDSAARTDGRAPRVLVVSDDPLARAGLAGLLSPGVLVGHAGTRDDVAAAVRALGADVVLWDLGADPRRLAEGMPDLDGLPVPVVALLPDDAWAAEALGAGARALLPRDAVAAVVGIAVEAVAHGLVVLDPVFSTALPRPSAPSPVREALADELTARELEVLGLLAEALPNKLIAHRLGISEHTVKFHVNAVMAKLGVQSRTEAVVRAARLGMVML